MRYAFYNLAGFARMVNAGMALASALPIVIGAALQAAGVPIGAFGWGVIAFVVAVDVASWFWIRSIFVPETSGVWVDESGVRVRAGSRYEAHFPLDRITGVYTGTPPLHVGLGLRLNFGVFGMITTRKVPAVGFTLARTHTMRLLPGFVFRYDKVWLTVEDPEALRADLVARGAPEREAP